MSARGVLLGVIRELVFGSILGGVTAPTVIPTNTIAPSVSGPLTIGQTLSASPGSWDHGPILSYAYQWQDSPDGIGSWANIGGATNQTYLIAIAAGRYVRVGVRATNVVGQSAQVFSAAYGPIAAVLSISGTPVTTATQNVAYTGFTVSSAGGHAPKTFSVFAGALPTGITLNPTTGVVSGTPTLVEVQAGIIIRVTDADGLTANLASFTITVSAASTGGAWQFNQAANSMVGLATGVW